MTMYAFDFYLMVSRVPFFIGTIGNKFIYLNKSSVISNNNNIITKKTEYNNPGIIITIVVSMSMYGIRKSTASNYIDGAVGRTPNLQ